MCVPEDKGDKMVTCAPVVVMQQGKGVFLTPSLQPSLHHPGGVGGGHCHHVSSLLKGGVSRG